MSAFYQSVIEDIEWSSEITSPVLQQLADEVPTTPQYRGDLSKAHSNLGIIWRKRGATGKADEATGKAIELRRLREVITVGTDGWLQVVDQDHQDVRLLFGCLQNQPGK